MASKSNAKIRSIRERDENEGQGQNVFSDLETYSRIPHWLIGMVEVSDGAIRLFAVLAKYADANTGKTWVGRKTLAVAMGVSLNTVDRRIKELVDAKALVVEERMNGIEQLTNFYFLKYRHPLGG